jgi:superfamily I DNA/RNA helicase
MALNHDVRLAIHSQFLKCFSKLQPKVQKKTNEFLKNFKTNPTDASLDFEPISTFSDSQLRTCRIGLEYRLIMRQPEKGDLYLILWIAHHDEAHAWATHKQFHLNEHNHAFEIFDEQIYSEVAKGSELISSPTLFNDYSHQQLTSLGISKRYVDLVKLVDNEETFATLQELLPPRAFSYLSMLIDPFNSYDEVHRLSQKELMYELSFAKTELSDLPEVVENKVNQEQLFVLTEDNDLDWILNKPLDLWRVFLHSSQREIVDRSVDGSVRVLGGAGTGKTVVALHRIKWLTSRLKANEKILFVTYTTTLVADLQSQLKQLISEEVMSKVEVKTVDSWLKDYYKQYETEEIAYWGNAESQISKEMQKAWNQALEQVPTTKSFDFLRMEWEQVILAQGVNDLSSYLFASRKGRGVPLKKKQRKELWSFFEQYVSNLYSRGIVEPEMASWSLVGRGLKTTLRCPYRSIVIDEAQDMSTATFRLFRVLLPKQDNDLFIVGDGHQKVYSRPISLKQAGIKIQGSGHAYRLRVNYRTTDKIHEAAMAVIRGQKIIDLDDKQHTLSDYQSLIIGEAPTLFKSTDGAKRREALLAWINELPKERLSELCVVVSTNGATEDYTHFLQDHGYPVYLLADNKAAENDRVGIRVATKHRVKGLEFSFIALMDQASDFRPSYLPQTQDELFTQQKYLEQRSLAYVAISRARERLFVAWDD